MKTKFPEIKTDRLLLRQFKENDLKNVFMGLSHPDVIRYYGISFETLEVTKEQINWFSTLEKESTGIWWAICSNDDNIFYGAGGLNSLSRKDRKAEAGFWLLPQFWHMGIMTEAMPLICEYGFTVLQLHRIEAFVETENITCKKAMEKLGFEHEGTMIDCEIKNGKYISWDIYAKFENQ